MNIEPQPVLGSRGAGEENTVPGEREQVSKGRDKNGDPGRQRGGECAWKGVSKVQSGGPQSGV